MYALTIIRINNTTGTFENTEVHGIKYEHEVLNELTAHGVNKTNLEEFLKMRTHSSITIEISITTGVMQGTRFFYITKF